MQDHWLILWVLQIVLKQEKVKYYNIILLGPKKKKKFTFRDLILKFGLEEYLKLLFYWFFSVASYVLLFHSGLGLAILFPWSFWWKLRI